MSESAAKTVEDELTRCALKAASGDWQALHDFLNNPTLRKRACNISKYVCRRYKASERYPEPRDLEQELYAELLTKITQFQGKDGSSVQTWLFRIATNLRLEELRREMRRRKILEASTQIPRSDESPQNIHKEVLLRIAMENLSYGEFREFELWISGNKLVQIAEELGISKSTVHRDLNAITKKLQDLVER